MFNIGTNKNSVSSLLYIKISIALLYFSTVLNSSVCTSTSKVFKAQTEGRLFFVGASFAEFFKNYVNNVSKMFFFFYHCMVLHLFPGVFQVGGQ